MKKFNITTQKVYQQGGEEKKFYPQVGKMVYFEANEGKPENYLLELNMFPGTKFYVFEDVPKDSYPTPKSEGINPDSIPF